MDPTKRKRRKRRRLRTRKTLRGSEERPRLAVFRSLKHIYAQVIDDENGRTLVACSTLSADVRKALKNTGNASAAEAVGKALGRKAKETGIRKVAFDRAGFKFHGRVKALAEGARSEGLDF